MGTISFEVSQDDLPDEVFYPVMEEIYNQIVEATPVRTGFAQSQWKYEETGSSVDISNDCEYISYLEDGWSDQAPDGMVGPAMDNLPDLLSSALEEYNTANQ